MCVYTYIYICIYIYIYIHIHAHIHDVNTHTHSLRSYLVREAVDITQSTPQEDIRPVFESSIFRGSFHYPFD